METQQIRAFVAVAEELHFGRAAQRLRMAQPPLSRIIRQLERDLGTELFERTTRSVRLTPAGEVLLGPAREVLASCRAAEAAVRAAGQGETGRVRIGFAGPSSLVLITTLARVVREENPGLELTFRSATYGYEAVSQLLASDIDLAISRWQSAPKGISSQVIQREHYVLVVPSNHRLADQKITSITDLRDERFVMLPGEPGSAVRDLFIDQCHEAGFSPNIVQIAPDSWTVMALVAAGVGITFSVDSAAREVPGGDLRAIPIREASMPSFARLAWRRGETNPAVRRVLSVSKRVLPSQSRGTD